MNRSGRTLISAVLAVTLSGAAMAQDAVSVGASHNPETGESIGKVLIDLLSFKDKKVRKFTAKSVTIKALQIAATIAACHVAMEYYDDVKGRDDKPEPSLPPPSGKGDIHLGRGVTVNGNVDTMGGNVTAAAGTTINGSINTGPAEEPEE